MEQQIDVSLSLKSINKNAEENNMVPVSVVLRLRNTDVNKLSTPVTDNIWKPFLRFDGLGLLCSFLWAIWKVLCLQNDTFGTFCLPYLCSVPSRFCARLCWGADGVRLLWAFMSIRHMFAFQTSWVLYMGLECSWGFPREGWKWILEMPYTVCSGFLLI